ncbi:MAG: TIGR01777 family oxidoreductase [Gammaproteobacteria bacterium]|nr:TIGR01777 family oxidoreductase [Gammaproteobacteria bacterium]
MTISTLLITGGTGFIGTQLQKHFAKKNIAVTLLKRDSPIEGTFDGIINLAGHPLNKNRWNQKIKKLIYDSRISTTQRIVDYIKNTPHKPKFLISGSAIGYYEAENTFSHKLCHDWEKTAREAENYGVRVCLMRTGIVLGKNGGALATMLPAFKLGLGAQIGNGLQWMSWIHMNDLINMIDFIITHEEINGPVNFTAPHPVTHKAFVQTLAKTLHRPCLLKLPEFIVKMLFGQMGQELLLTGKPILPDKVLSLGYHFKFPLLKEALNDIFGDAS